MPPELTLESLDKKLTDLHSLIASTKTAQDEKEEKEKEAKRAQEEKEEEEKKQAKKAAYDSAIKAAMEEEDHDKKDAMIRKAQEEYDDKDKKHEGFGKPDDEKHEATEEEKEKDAQIASIIEDKKNDLINKILTANSIMNPTKIKEVEARLKKASITDVQKEWDILKPAFEGSVKQSPPPEKFIPFYANATPADVDASQLSASSPDSDFAKFTTKELLEMGQ